MFRVSVIIGTRPEAIKLAPVILELKKHKSIQTRVILSGQHIEIVLQVINLFEIKEDHNLEIMKQSQSINAINAKILTKLELEFQRNKTDLIIVQGDTTTTFSAAIAAFYQKIPIAHVEAGLRTNDLYEPFPEEANRRLISQIATLHFAPTDSSKQNLIDSGVESGKIFITGNTVVDSLLSIANKHDCNNLNIDKFKEHKGNEIILTTIHRRENWGEPLANICDGLKMILEKHNDIVIVIPLHPNKDVREIIKSKLSNNSRAKLIEPLPYDELVYLIKKCKLVLTDSGGLQEEAPALGKPVLILRGNTERIEALNAGTTKLVGTNSNSIFKECNSLLTDKNEYDKMANSINPYGNGKSSKLIVDQCLNFLEQVSKI